MFEGTSKIEILRHIRQTAEAQEKRKVKRQSESLVYSDASIFFFFFFFGTVLG